eukprot:372789_1
MVQFNRRDVISCARDPNQGTAGGGQTTVSGSQPSVAIHSLPPVELKKDKSNELSSPTTKEHSNEDTTRAKSDHISTQSVIQWAVQNSLKITTDVSTDPNSAWQMLQAFKYMI